MRLGRRRHAFRNLRRLELLLGRMLVAIAGEADEFRCREATRRSLLASGGCPADARSRGRTGSLGPSRPDATSCGAERDGPATRR